MKGKTFALSLFVAVTALPAPAQRADLPDRPPRDGERPLRRPDQPDQPRVRMGPWNRDLNILRSRDGLTFSESKVFVERGGVPCLAQDKSGRLIAVFQWFPMDRREDFDKIGVVFSEDGGKNWTAPRAIEITGQPAELERAFDPTLVSLDDGKFRLYFTSKPGADNTAIYSAVSGDAVRFTFEPGQRFAAAEENVVDCSVAKLGDAWQLFAPLPRHAGRAYHATSKDGLKFERQPDVSAEVNGTWIGNVINTGESLRFYGSGRGGVWSASSRDGVNWSADDGQRAPGGDPAAWPLKGGGYVMVVTGGPRADAPMDPPWRQEFARAAERADPAPGDAQRPRFADITGPVPAGNVAVTANSEFVFVVRDGVLYQFGARDLNLLKQTNIPEPPRRPVRPPGVRQPGDGEPVRPRQ